jgi:uncharacterized protein YbgA (DUF1722 family)/uncharacterized protein YbbK (DUF523 family)
VIPQPSSGEIAHPYRKGHSIVKKLRIGISACLLGQEVRFDGSHKRDRFLTEAFADYAEWVSVCPELEMGLGVPRPTLRLEKDGDQTRLIMPKTGEDYSEQMATFAEERVDRLTALKLDGYVLKSRSPSCGMERVKIYPHAGSSGSFASKGVGHFAAVLMKCLPNLPVEEEGRMHDPPLRENFVSRLFAYQRWQALVANGVTRAALTTFHAAHKYQMMAHNQTRLRNAGRLLANPDAFASDDELATAYLAEFTQIMQRAPSPRNHSNALQHMVGYFTKELDAQDTAEMTQAIDDYRLGLLPLIVPITLIRHYVRKFDVTYLQDQVYLFPHPHELMLLNRL